MAIVRRAVGRATVPGSVPGGVSGGVAVPAPGFGEPAHQIPTQPGLPGQAGQPAQAQLAPGQAVPGQEMAASVPSPPAKAWSVAAGFGLAGVGALGAWNVNQMVQPTAFQVGSATSAFAALFVFAAAVERLIEPITRWMPGRAAQASYERALADVDNGVPGAIHAAAYHKAAVDQSRSSRALITWGLATGFSTILSASAGFYLLRMISATPNWNGVAPWVDALVTGLVVGTGTKPLHDLFVRVQNN